MIIPRKTRRILGLSMISLSVFCVSILIMRYNGFFKIGADTLGPSAPSAKLSPNASSYFKFSTLMYANSFDGNKSSWIKNHVDKAIVNVAGDTSSLGVAAYRYSNWRDINEITPVVFSFDELLSYYQTHDEDADKAFVHFSSDTAFVREKANATPLPSYNNRLQKVFTVAASAQVATALPDSASRLDVTAEAYGDKNVPTMPADFPIKIGEDASSQYLMVGHAWKFDQLNFNLSAPATSGWVSNFEYFDGSKWVQLSLISDMTAGLSKTGSVHFAPPADWISTTLPGETSSNYWLRLSDKNLTAAVTLNSRKIKEDKNDWDGQPAVSITSYETADYPPYSGYREKVIVPGWSARNDANSDGYVDDSEFLVRPVNTASARFSYQARVPSVYLLGRWEANYADLTYQNFVIERLNNLLADSHTSHVFVDNAYTSLQLPNSFTVPTPDDIRGLNPDLGYVEYSNDNDLRQSAVSFLSRLQADKSIADIVINGAAESSTIPVIDGMMLEGAIGYSRSVSEESPAGLEEKWNQIKTFSAAKKEIIVAAYADPKRNDHPALVDPTTKKWLPAGWSRAQMYDLSRYYLTATPFTFFQLQLNADPQSGWSELMSRDLGDATGDYYLAATDTVHGSYVYRRDFANGSVLVKTMAPDGQSMDASTSYSLDLGGKFHPMDLSNNLQQITTSISLKNFEGSVLLKNRPPVWTQSEIQSVKVGDTTRFVLSVNDPDGDELDVKILKPVSGASIVVEGNARVLVFSPDSSQIGIASVELSVSDGDETSESVISYNIGSTLAATIEFNSGNSAVTTDTVKNIKSTKNVGKSTSDVPDSPASNATPSQATLKTESKFVAAPEKLATSVESRTWSPAESAQSKHLNVALLISAIVFALAGYYLLSRDKTSFVPAQ